MTEAWLNCPQCGERYGAWVSICPKCGQYNKSFKPRKSIWKKVKLGVSVVSVAFVGLVLISFAINLSVGKPIQEQPSADYVAAAVRLDEGYKKMLDSCVVDSGDGTRTVSDDGCIALMKQMKDKCATFTQQDLKYITNCSDSRLKLIR